jgi:hypothetical protein
MAAPLFPAADPTGAYAALYQRSIDDPSGFWAEQAQRIDWFEPFTQVLDDSRPPFARWFVGGRTNLCHNAVDRHAARRPTAPALIWHSSEVDQDRPGPLPSCWPRSRPWPPACRTPGSVRATAC